jgi:hypothetical protein
VVGNRERLRRGTKLAGRLGPALTGCRVLSNRQSLTDEDRQKEFPYPVSPVGIRKKNGLDSDRQLLNTMKYFVFFCVFENSEIIICRENKHTNLEVQLQCIFYT